MSDEQKDILSGLTRLGLTQYEAKVYSTIVTNGTCTAKDISNICGIPYGKTYEVINSLVNRGFAIVLPVKPMKYKPADCEETLRILQSNMSQELERAKGVFSSLKEKQKETGIYEPRGSFWVLRGRSAINNKIEDLVRKARKSIMLFLSGNAIYRIMYFKELFEQKKKEGINISVITTKHSDDGICSLWSCSFCDDRNMDTKSNFISVDSEESIIFESIPDDKNYTTGTDVGISILEKSTTSFLESMFSVFNVYRHLLMSSTNAIFILDAETMEVIEANSKCSGLIGLDRGALVGKNVKDIAKQLGMISPSSFDSYLKKLKKEKSVNIKNFEINTGSNAIIANVSAHIQKFYGKDAIIITVTDVTHEKQVEHERATISERYSHMFNALPLPAILLSKDDKVLMANKAIEEEFGFKLGDRKDFSIYKAIPKEKQRAMKRLRRVSLKRDTVVKLPLITTKGIKEFIIFASKADSEGNKIVVCKDLSELQDLKRSKKDVKKELETSKGRWASLTGNTDDIIMIVDSKGIIQYINKIIPPYTPEKTVGNSVYDYTIKEHHETMRGSLKRVFKTGKPISYEVSSDIPKAGIMVFNTKVVPIKKGNKIISAILLSTNVTERKKVDEALNKSAQLLKDTGKMAKVGGWELDLSTKEVSWTDEVGQIHGVKPGYKPKLDEALNFYAPESRPAVEAAVKNAAETGESYDIESLFIPLGSKDTIWVRSLGKAVYSGGKIVKLTGTFQNIDKYKKAEEQINNIAKFPSENPNPVMRISTEGVILYANKAASNLTNTGLIQSGLKLPDEWAQIIKEAFGSNKNKTIEFKVQNKNYLFMLTPIREGRYVNIYGTDTTEQKRAEEILKDKIEQLERFSKLVIGREEKMIELKNTIRGLRGLNEDGKTTA